MAQATVEFQNVSNSLELNYQHLHNRAGNTTIIAGIYNNYSDICTMLFALPTCFKITTLA